MEGSEKDIGITHPKAQDFGDGVGEVDDGGRIFGQQFGVDDGTDVFSVEFFDLAGVVEVLAFEVVGGDVEQGCSHEFEDGEDHGMIGDADAHFFAFALEVARDFFGGLKDQCVRAGEYAFGDTVGDIADIAVLGNLLERGGQERTGLVFGAVGDAIEFFNGFALVHIAPKAVACIGGVAQDLAILEDLDGALKFSRLGVVFVEYEQHGLSVGIRCG